MSSDLNIGLFPGNSTFRIHSRQTVSIFGQDSPALIDASGDLLAMYKLITLAYLYNQERETGFFRGKFTLGIPKLKFTYEPDL